MGCNTKCEKRLKIRFVCILLVLFYMLNFTNGERQHEKKWNLLYSARAEVTMKDGGQHEWLEMQISIDPVKCEKQPWLSLSRMTVLEIDSDHEHFQGDDEQLANHILYFSQSESGLISTLYYSTAAEQEFTNIQKYILSGISGHFIKHSEKYKNREIEYYGHHEHEYTSKKRNKQHLYYRNKVQSENIQHNNSKEIILDEDGNVQLARVNDMFGDEGFLSHGASGNLEIKLIRKRKVEVQLINKDVLSSMVVSTLQISLEDTDIPTIHEAETQIQNILKDVINHKQNSTEYKNYTNKANEILETQPSAWLIKYCLPIITQSCEKNCQLRKEFLIKSIARIGSPASQLLVVEFLKLCNKESSVVKILTETVLTWENPTKAIIMYLGERCFGKNDKFHGVLAIDKEQTRFCLVLGAALSQTSENKLASAYVKKFHSWLESSAHKQKRDTNLHANIPETIMVSAKATLLHVLGNIAHPDSRELILSHIEENKHPRLRVTALKALRGFGCEQTATALLNTTVNERDHIVRRAAYDTYKKHSRAFNLGFVDENILLSKKPDLVLPIRKRGVLCNTIEDMTVDDSFDVQKQDKEESTGDQDFGFRARTKQDITAKIHNSPGETYFEVTSHSNGFLNAWIRPDGKHYEYDVMESEWCLHREFRVFNGSMFKTADISYLQRRISDYDSRFEEITKSLVDILNTFYQKLGHRVPELGYFDLYTTTILKNQIQEVIHQNYKDGNIDDIYTHIQKQVKALQGLLDQRYGSTYILPRIMDKCLFQIDYAELVSNVDSVAQDMFQCIDASNPSYTYKAGLMSRVNELTSSIQDLHTRTTATSDLLKETSRWMNTLPYADWSNKVALLTRKMRIFTTDFDIAATSYLNDISQEIFSSLPSIAETIDGMISGIESNILKFKDTPTEASAFLQILMKSLKGEMSKIMAWRHQIQNIGQQYQGKVESWLDLGPHYFNLLQEGNMMMKRLRETDNPDTSSASIRDKIFQKNNIQRIKSEALDKFEVVFHEFKDILYIGDETVIAMDNFILEMNKVTADFEQFKVSFEKSTQLLQQSLGLKFHHKFPRQIRYECDEDCGGCGMFPNIYHGRSGVQLFADENTWIVSPTNGLVKQLDEDSIIIYPFGLDWDEYEVIIANVVLNQSLIDNPDTAYVIAGITIGKVERSNCQPNFIHVSVRKVNSSEGTFASNDDELNSCGSPADNGVYLSVDQFLRVDNPDIKSLYMDHDGCNTFEFLFNKKVADISDMTSRYDVSKQEIKRTAGDVSDDIDGHIKVDPIYPGNEDEEVMQTLSQFHKDKIANYYIDVQKLSFDKNTETGYVVEDGVRRKKVTSKHRNTVPTITDYINANEMTVQQHIDMLIQTGMTDLAEELTKAVSQVQHYLLSLSDSTIEDIGAAKLRTKNQQRGFPVNKDYDHMRANLKTLKECPSLEHMTTFGENLFCETTKDCRGLVCHVSLDTELGKIDAPLHIYFNDCEQSLRFVWFNESIDIQNDTDMLHLMHVDDTMKIALNINVRFIQLKGVQLSLSSKVCYVYAPYCEEMMKIIENYSYKMKCLDIPGIDKHAWCDRSIPYCNEYCAEETILPRPLCKKICTAPNKTICDIANVKMREFYQIVKNKICGGVPKGCYKEMLKDYLFTNFKTLDTIRNIITKINNICDIPIVRFFCFVLGRLKVDIGIEMSDKMTVQDGSKAHSFSTGNFWIDVKIRLVILKVEVKVDGDIHVYQLFDTSYIPKNLFQLTHNIRINGQITKVKGKVFLLLYTYVIKDHLRPAIVGNFDIVTGINWTESCLKLYGDVVVQFDAICIKVIATHKACFIPVANVDKYFGCTEGRDLYMGLEMELWCPDWNLNFMGIPIIGEYGLITEKHGLVSGLSNSESCSIEQVPGRNIGESAYRIEAAFYDTISNLEVEYAIGTYREGQDVRAWSPYDGGLQVVPWKLQPSGIPLYFSVRAKKEVNKMEKIITCVLPTMDVTPPQGRIDYSFQFSSHTSKLHASLQVVDDSPLLDTSQISVGYGQGVFGYQTIPWHDFTLTDTPINEEGEGDLKNFANSKSGKLPTSPIKTISSVIKDEDCALACVNYGEQCVAFDYEYKREVCDLHGNIESKDLRLAKSGSYFHFERLGAGHSAWFGFDGLNLIHGQSYYFNAKLENNKGFISMPHSYEIVVDFTTPEPGPIGDVLYDEIRHDNCSATVTHGDRCIDVTSIPNHRIIVDGEGGKTVFNGNQAEFDNLFTLINHYATGNWAPFRDNETGIWGYTWAVGSEICSPDIHPFEDPHSHLADDSYWTYQGFANDLNLDDGPYYITVQSLNQVVFGGALVTSVCHSIPFTVDTSAPILHSVDNVFYDLDFDIMGIYYNGSDPESGIARVDIGLGETKHDVLVRPYSKHDPIHDGYEMVSLDAVDLPEGVVIWIRLRLVNRVTLLTAGHGEDPIMIDTSPPITGELYDGEEYMTDLMYQPFDDYICAQWFNWYDPESGLSRFVWGVGSKPFTTNIYNYTEFSHFEKFACVEVELNHSQTYYSTLRAYNNALNSRMSNKSSSGITVDMTDPEVGWVHDGKQRDEDIVYSSEAASLFTNWGDFKDPESGIDKYHITLYVNGEEEESFSENGDVEYLEDHSLHFKHGDSVQVNVEAVNGATRTSSSDSTGFTVDLTQPEVILLKNHPDGLLYQTSDSSIYATWQFSDVESKIAKYQMRILEVISLNKIPIWPIGEAYRDFIANPLNGYFVETEIAAVLKNGHKYVVDVIATNGAGLGSKHESHAVTVDITQPVISQVTIGTEKNQEDLNDDGQVMHLDPNGIPVNWLSYDHESGVITQFIAIGTSEGDVSITNGFREVGKIQQHYIDDIELEPTSVNGTLYYVTIIAQNGAGDMSIPTSSKPIYVYSENVPGRVFIGKNMFATNYYQQDTRTIAISFHGFESEMCGVVSYEWSLGYQPGYSDIIPFSSYGIVLVNETHGFAQIDIEMMNGVEVFASVKAYTGNKCPEATLLSTSNGIIIDQNPPIIEIITIGIFENSSKISQNMYQSEFSTIDLQWESNDDHSLYVNDTWCAGTLPYLENIHEWTSSESFEIDVNEVQLLHGETVYFTISSTDSAGNMETLSSQPLTIDTTGPIVEGFTCTDSISIAQTYIKCKWKLNVDQESPIKNKKILVGTSQFDDSIVKFQQIPDDITEWMNNVDVNSVSNVSEIVITLAASNEVNKEAGVFTHVVLDTTPPQPGILHIVTPIGPGEDLVPQVCQLSTSTMQLQWTNFVDDESGIDRYEVSLGTEEVPTAVMQVITAGKNTTIFISNLEMMPGSKVFAFVRAVNRANLVSGSAYSSIYISPNPSVYVADGLKDDIDYQNELSAISGNIKLYDYCPLITLEWFISDLKGDVIINMTQFYGNQFQNDELELINFQTYFVEVVIVDVLNRTIYGRSNGVTTVIQPPIPAEVRDGREYGVDINFQPSVIEVSCNWDPFGSDLPGFAITKYEVSLGSDTSVETGLSNVHAFTDVGQNLSYSFTNLNLKIKTTKYFCTVKATSETGATIRSTSNGLRTGFDETMLYGGITVSRYLNSTEISFFWDEFKSDFPLIKYLWGVSDYNYFEYDNITESCDILIDAFERWSNIVELKNNGRDTFVGETALPILHGRKYFLRVLGKDASGQCIVSPEEEFLYDATPPNIGLISTGNDGGYVQYSTENNILTVNWHLFNDPESGILNFIIKLFDVLNCNEDGNYTLKALSERILVSNQTQYAFLNLDLQTDVEYRIGFDVTNGAQNTVSNLSQPIYLENTPPSSGTVKMGKKWTGNAVSYQSSTSELNAIIAISPYGILFDCPLEESIIDQNNTWQPVNDEILYFPNNSNTWENIYIEYQDRNVHVTDSGTLMFNFHNNISNHHLEGGALIYENFTINPGTYSFQAILPETDSTIFSMTISEGKFEEYVSFDLPEVVDQLSDDDFMKDAIFENDEDETVTPTEYDHAFTTLPYGDSWLNMSRSLIPKDEFNTSAIGLHLLCFSLGNKTKEWKMMVWNRQANTINYYWVAIPLNPTENSIKYSIDFVSYHKNSWNIQVKLDGIFIAEFEELYFPSYVNLVMRPWTYNYDVPPVDNPFNPFQSWITMKETIFPLEKTRPCQYGTPFFDMESGIRKIFVGASNITGLTENIAGFNFETELCYPCTKPCDTYKCDPDCRFEMTDGYILVNVNVVNLTLLPSIGQEEFVHYFVNVKVTNGVDDYSIASSNGVLVDISPPLFNYIFACDPLITDVPIQTAFQSSNDSLAASWECFDDESPIISLKIAIGLTPNGTEVREFEYIENTEHIVIDNLFGLLKHGETYFLTIKGTNAAGLSSIVTTDGVTILNLEPDVSNMTATAINETLIGCTDEACSVWSQDMIGIHVGEIKDENVISVGWSIGTGPFDDYIISQQYVPRNISETIEIRDSYAWYRGINSTISLSMIAQLHGQVPPTLEDEYLYPGDLWLEPGRCLFTHLKVFSITQQSSDINVLPTCIRRLKDAEVESQGLIDSTFSSDDGFKIHITGQGLHGRFTFGFLSEKDTKEDYVNSANTSYSPFIVDPDTAFTNTCRAMTNRVQEWTDLAFYMTPFPSSIMESSIDIKMDVSNISISDAQTLDLLLWNPESMEWCTSKCHAGYTAKDILEFKLCKNNFPMPLDGTSYPWALEPMMMALFKVERESNNTAPTLDQTVFIIDANSILEGYLMYTDAENDQVFFTLLSQPMYGNATLNHNGLFFYKPDQFFFGVDTILIEMREILLPPGIKANVVQTNITIAVKEIPFAPSLFYAELDNTDIQLHQGIVVRQFEANATEQELGEFYLCDYNPSDTLDLLHQVYNSSAEVIIDIVSEHQPNENIPDFADICFDRNLIHYKLKISTTKDYHGQMQIVLIGKDNYTFYSQPIVFDISVMVSPCIDGQCTSVHDPQCVSNDRAYSFEGYECSCKFFHTGQWCEYVSAGSIMIILGLVAMCVFAVFGVTVTRRRMLVAKISPDEMEEDEIEMNEEIDESGVEEDETESSGEEESTLDNADQTESTFTEVVADGCTEGASEDTAQMNKRYAAYGIQRKQQLGEEDLMQFKNSHMISSDMAKPAGQGPVKRKQGSQKKSPKQKTKKSAKNKINPQK